MTKLRIKYRNKRLTGKAIIVDKPDTLLNKCIESIRVQLKNKNVQFVKDARRSKTGKMIYSLQGGNGSKAIDAESLREQWVINIPTSGDDKYWLGASLTFIDHLAQFKLEGVSVRVFKGLISDLYKIPLFRAEWDADKASTRTEHAQPHWHVYSVSTIETGFETNIKQESPVDFNERMDNNREEIDVWSSSDKFHFAMCSSWHTDDKHQVELSDESHLINWLNRCIAYIQKQLEYISGNISDNKIN